MRSYNLISVCGMLLYIQQGERVLAAPSSLIGTPPSLSFDAFEPAPVDGAYVRAESIHSISSKDDTEYNPTGRGNPTLDSADPEYLEPYASQYKGLLGGYVLYSSDQKIGSITQANPEIPATHLLVELATDPQASIEYLYKPWAAQFNPPSSLPSTEFYQQYPSSSLSARDITIWQRMLIDQYLILVSQSDAVAPTLAALRPLVVTSIQYWLAALKLVYAEQELEYANNSRASLYNRPQFTPLSAEKEEKALQAVAPENIYEAIDASRSEAEAHLCMYSTYWSEDIATDNLQQTISKEVFENLCDITAMEDSTVVKLFQAAKAQQQPSLQAYISQNYPQAAATLASKGQFLDIIIYHYSIAQMNQ
ncbi:hypothetical protein H4R33_001401 [Dimargaris cristalligena]|uniref:Uncharacterized protein n=1 Tax=Dimargaris cristalligena TaxID=215637 RepID=A0A4P9ZZH3_9FUNG|nr:hypothetical protein H4R33_001401 [Dimargaris cristalligena]RKP38828.1 hypothetical protein BJ085DRAFT_37113 [Dimargaris cristalligena]|eukprot:RKP38828.1 hypothetical protein BJ085DRAFT_37113 [Dimargaris cristalligena]